MSYSLGLFVFLLLLWDSKVYKQMLAKSKGYYFYYHHYKVKLCKCLWVTARWPQVMLGSEQDKGMLWLLFCRWCLTAEYQIILDKA